LSPLGPLGPVRPVLKSHPATFDWAALGIGTAALVLVLVAFACLSAYRAAPHRVTVYRRRARRRTSIGTRVATSAGLSTPAVTGTRFALERGVGPASVAVRSAMVGTAVAA